jgi:predicted permease
MWNAYPGAGVDETARGSNGAPDYFDRRALTDVFEELAAYDYGGYTIEIDGVPQRLDGFEVTPSFFGLLRAQTLVGRTFTEAEQEPGQEQVVILSYGLWQQLYGGDTSVLGVSMRINGQSYTIVGVMDPDFHFLDEAVRLWTPLAFTTEQRAAYHSNSWNMMARLRDDVTIEQAQARIDALNAANMDLIPELKPLLVDAGFHTPLRFLQDDQVRDVRANLYMLWAGVSFVLLIGCVNVANLVFVRSTARARELATRFALGASRRRVLRLLLTETLLVTLIGGGLGLLVAQIGIGTREYSGAGELPRGEQIGLDLTAVGFTAGLALVVAVLVAVLPLASALRVQMTTVLHEDDRGGTSTRGTRVLRKGLVAAQVALALVLLVGTGLLLESFRAALAVDPGFDSENVLTGAVVLNETRYPDDAAMRLFADDALRRIRALPGVEVAGITSHVPFGAGFSDSVIFAEGYVMEPGESVISPTRFVTSPGYFDAMDIRVLEGRNFDTRDTADSQPVMLIDERLANRFWPDGNALGKRMWTPMSAEQVLDPEGAPHFDIIGIVEPILIRGLTTEFDPSGAYYFPLAQSSRSYLDFVVETATDPGAQIEPVRRTFADLDRQLAFFDIHTMDERISDSLTDRRTPLLLASGFSLIALVLAAVGIYGALAYLVQLRRREIGIRVALGSDNAGVFGIVLREGAWIVALGLAGGLAGVVLLGRAIENQLYGVTPVDPSVLGSVVGVLALVALGACLLPAWKAIRIDPVRVLSEQ